jgi:hypothetical protein
MMNLALRSNGTVEVTASTAGYVQPGTVSVMRGTFGRASASGRAYLYGNCGDPNNLATCVYYSVGAVTARWRATSVATSWNETKNVTNAGSRYIFKTSRARGRRWRQAWLCSGAALGTWPVSGQVSGINISQSVTCPGPCPRSAQQRAPTAIPS